MSSCMGAVFSVPTCIFIPELLYKASRKSTSGTPKPRRIAQRQECPAELYTFGKSRIGSAYLIVSWLVVVPNELFVLLFVILGGLGSHIGSPPSSHISLLSF